MDYGDLGEYVECQSCNSTWSPEVLSLPPPVEISDDQIEDAADLAIRQLVTAMIVVDGEIQAGELEFAVDLLNDFGIEYEERRLKEDLAGGAGHLPELLELVAQHAPMAVRLQMIEIAILISGADDVIGQSEMDLYIDAGHRLGLQPRQLKKIFESCINVKQPE